MSIEKPFKRNIRPFTDCLCRPFKEKKEIAGYLEKSKKGINLLTENINKNQ